MTKDRATTFLTLTGISADVVQPHSVVIASDVNAAFIWDEG